MKTTPSNAAAHTDLARRLGLGVPTPNRFQRLQQRLAATRPVAWLCSLTLDPVDSALDRMSGGRMNVPGVMAGLPVVFLTTTGARTGRERRRPLVGIPFDGGVGVIGTNYGGPRTPDWVLNLEARPAARLSYHDVTLDVRAEPVDTATLERLFAAGSAIYPGYAKYRSRIGGRRIRGFILRTADDGQSG